MLIRSLLVFCCILIISTASSGKISAAQLQKVSIDSLDGGLLLLPRLIYRQKLPGENVSSALAELQALLAGADNPNWKSVSPSDFRYIDDTTHWFAFALNNSDQHPRTAIISGSITGSRLMSAALIDQQGIQHFSQSGPLVPYQDWPIKTYSPDLPLNLQPQQTVLVLVANQFATTTVVRQLKLWDRSEFFSTRDPVRIIIDLSLGILVVMGLYHVFIYLVTLSRVYLYYSLLVFVSALIMATNGGYLFQFIPAEKLQSALALQGTIAALFMITMGLFTNSFMRFHLINPPLFRAIRVVIVASSVTLLASIISGWQLLASALFLLAVPFYCLLWFCSIYYSLRGNLNAMIYLIAFSIYLVGWVITWVAVFFGHNIATPYIAYILVTSQILQVVFFALALALKIRQLVTDKHLARLEAQTKSAFMAKMSHEIRTPMSGVLGMSELLGDMGLTKEQKHCNDIIYSSGNALLTVINDILDYSKIEAGKLELENIDFDLKKLSEDVLAMFRMTEKTIELQLNIVTDVNLLRRGDPDRVRQIIVNLLGNALKFTEHGFVRLSIENTDDKDSLRFSVKDSGCGISKEAQQRLFEAFSQADTSTSRQYGGTGLGLTICKELAQMMNGAITVNSALGKGSTFSVTLQLPAAAATALETVRSKPKAAVSRRLNILVAEDNPVNQMVLKGMLEKLGQNAIYASNGEQTVALFQSSIGNKPFDLVFMDCEMPRLDGYEATRQIRQLEKEYGLEPIPIAALTAHAMLEEREKCMAAGMDDFLTKPLKADVLESALIGVISTMARDQDTTASQTQYCPG